MKRVIGIQTSTTPAQFKKVLASYSKDCQIYVYAGSAEVSVTKAALVRAFEAKPYHRAVATYWDNNTLDVRFEI